MEGEKEVKIDILSFRQYRLFQKYDVKYRYTHGGELDNIARSTQHYTVLNTTNPRFDGYNLIYLDLNYN